MFKELLKQCSEGGRLTRLEAKQAMDEIMKGIIPSSQIAALLAILRLRGETVAEMTGFAQSMREYAVSVEHNEGNVLDTCGTGGDNLETFNISTTVAILTSASKVKVAKHGNRAVSSKSGSADVLEQLGISVQSSPPEAKEALTKKGLCFLFAPLYHQSMKHVVEVRRQLGFKTVFNLLGPLVNPAKANCQLIGVFDPLLAEKMAETLRELGVQRALLVTGGEGLDECSISTYTDVVELAKGEIIRYKITPDEVGLNYGSLRDIQVNSVVASAALVEDVLAGTANEAAKNIVLFNSGAALYVAGEAETIRDGVRQARELLTSGKGLAQLHLLQTSKGGAKC